MGQQCMTQEHLELECEIYEDIGGTSAYCRPYGFRPAFYDLQTRTIYMSRFSDGRPAPVHMLDGLPEHLVLARQAGGHVTSVKGSLISGFEMYGRFYTRDEASALLALRH